MANCILQYEFVEDRSEAIEHLITVAEVNTLASRIICVVDVLYLQHCLEMRNYSSMMAIVVAGLGSAPIRRLHQSWAGVQKERKDLFKEIDTLLDSKVRMLLLPSAMCVYLCMNVPAEQL